MNGLIKIGVRRGWPPRSTHLLKVRGRHSGEVRSVPLAVVEQDGARWMVAQVPNSGWVHNLRAAGECVLSRAGNDEEVTVIEIDDPQPTSRVLKAYVDATGSVTGKYFQAKKDDPASVWDEEASRHPVFKILANEMTAATGGRL